MGDEGSGQREAPLANPGQPPEAAVRTPLGPGTPLTSGVPAAFVSGRGTDSPLPEPGVSHSRDRVALANGLG